MRAALVSPVERPTSCLPLKVINVLCVRTLNFRSRSFWVSKSISNEVTSLNLGFVARLARMGAWALQVGHQGAVTSTRIGKPAAWAASKAAALNGFLANALAGAAVTRIVDAASAVKISRRVSIWSLSSYIVHDASVTAGLYPHFPNASDQNRTAPDQKNVEDLIPRRLRMSLNHCQGLRLAPLVTTRRSIVPISSARRASAAFISSDAVSDVVV